MRCDEPPRKRLYACEYVCELEFVNERAINGDFISNESNRRDRIETNVLTCIFYTSIARRYEEYVNHRDNFVQFCANFV